MQIKSLYDKNEIVTIQDYISKCGVKNVDKWLRRNIIEPSVNYDNIDKWCEELRICLNSTNKISLLVDSDVDGYFSSSMFYIYCKSINPNAQIIPLFHKGKEHGLSDENIINEMSSEEPHTLIVLDAGSNDIEIDKFATQAGWKILCADHHIQEKHNPYCLLVNNQTSTNVQNKELSGTGVAWKICKRFDELYGYNYANDLISYVMVANIGDSMSLLTAENETFRYWGTRNIHPNIKPFVEAFNKDCDTDNRAFSYGLITNINSLIRLGTQDEKRDLFYALCGLNDGKNIIKICSKLHRKQSDETKRILEKCVNIVHNDKFVLGHIQEKTTLSGLVANKMLSKYNKPIILVHERDNGEMAGSSRSPIEFKNILNSTNLFNYNQGHEQAFGTSYQKENEQDIIKCLNVIEMPSEPTQEVFMSLATKDIPNYLYGFIEQNSGIFGKDIPEPRIHIQPFSIYNTEIQTIGANQTTLKFRRDGIDFMVFFASKEFKEKLMLDKEKTNLILSFIGTPNYNVWNGNKYKQFIIDTNTIEIDTKEYNIRDFI